MRKWSVMLSLVFGLVAVGWALWRTGGGDARGEFDAQAAHSTIQIRALEVLNDKVSPSQALPYAQGWLWVLQQYGGDRVSRRELDGSWVTVVGAGVRESDGGQASRCECSIARRHRLCT
ncbi:hypothetical protein CTATCC11996_14193 [Comamonas testosteroni ATCC 11996]|nr:hypothetical protein CTATCC11996_14193 [Comamonas testosteroni ATCC 11996]